MDGVSFRAGRLADAEEITRTLELGFEVFSAFLPEGFEAPPPMMEPLRARLADPAVWCRVAESDGEMAGHVSLMPAALHAGRPDPDPSLAHLWQLFVREERWGSGIATALHEAAVEEAARRGFSTFRLFTPVAQTRARRFYERRAGGSRPRRSPRSTGEEWSSANTAARSADG
jgi:GNAT superfamily N-acetyltransferase